ncbi:mitochondrial small ribosomal subunit Rsm22-domain-containing protein [Mycotypha africana]|uniref:mitochondrial small ribosomal subunit Rsm22-domain-containing protein n=1 Tax=Mycotypha africana TaxID=64632 RepID=UPI0023016B96|nr:mitochondrial small ribosomal subunit Rsm22-domain-containing protein [Mycotypha africana]KAI8975497.1 mitochondrial small ribosomal subunit Rsm22-domain-containing protein [Mycotypha africana]
MFCRHLAKRFLLARSYSTSQKAIFLTEKELQSLDLNQEGKILVKELKEETYDDTDYFRISKEAEFGSKRIGRVQLPKPLIDGISALIEEHEKPLIREDALRIFKSYQLRYSSPKPSDVISKGKRTGQLQQPEQPFRITYGARESIAYAAGLLPSSFAATYSVMKEIAKRMPSFKPQSMLDFGTGPGTAIWAAKEVFDIQRCMGVDLSEEMLSVAEKLERYIKKEKDQPIEFSRFLSFNPNSPKNDLVVSTFTLGDLPSKAIQKSTVEQLWKQTDDVLVLIDKGTPVGYKNIAMARQWILNLEGLNKVHTVAPYPHDYPCPLLYSPEANITKMWSHFSQQLERPAFLMKTKHSKSNKEDIKYSYVILRRGPRPTVTSEGNDQNMEVQAYSWPRLIQPPIKKKGHVIMDIFAKTGEVQRMIIPKSQGKVEYRDARKSNWGDLFPHISKNKLVTRFSRGEHILDEELDEEFGGRKKDEKKANKLKKKKRDD